MLTILNLALPFFGLIVIGFIATRFFSFDELGLGWLNVLIVYFALPAMIYLTVSQAPFEKLVDWPFITATTLATYIAFNVAFVTSVFILRRRITSAAIQGTAASFGNVGYMGLPLAVLFFGPEAAVPAALIFSFDNALQFILTPLLATLGEGEGGHKRNNWHLAGKIAKSIFTHPFIIATILGALASALKLKTPLIGENFLHMLSGAAGPCALFALGVTLGRRKLEGIGLEFPVIVLTKLIIHPLLVYATLSLLGGVDDLWLHVALMMAALPTATNAYVLASQYKAYIEGASSAILVTTAISALTLPVLVYMAKTGMIPGV